MARTTSSTSFCPETMMMGTFDSMARTGLMRSTPLPSGRKMSRMTQSGRCFSNRSSPSALLKAVTTFIPFSDRIFCVNWVKTGSSSTSRIRLSLIHPLLWTQGSNANGMPAEKKYIFCDVLFPRPVQNSRNYWKIKFYTEGVTRAVKWKKIQQYWNKCENVILIVRNCYAGREKYTTEP